MVLGACELVEGILSGRLSCREAVGLSLAAVESLDIEVRAWTTVGSGLRASGSTAYNETARHLRLLSVPVGVKDIIDTCDMDTECGTPLYRQRRPSWDAGCVALLRQAGAVIFGKTVTAELGYFAAGPTRNPAALGHTPGGSSSGSAAAVAAGMVPIALGAQTAGSVIRPASFCGCIGYVASHGHLMLAGVKALAPSFDSLGIFARSVADVELVYSVLRDARTVVTDADDIQGPKVTGRMTRAGVWLGKEIGVSGEMQEAVVRTARQLERAGVDLVEVEADSQNDELAAAHATVMAFEAARSLAYEGQFADVLSSSLRELLEQGRGVGQTTLREAWTRIEAGRRRWKGVLSSVSVVLAPGALGGAPKGLTSTGSPIVSRVFQALGVPALVLPVSSTRDGLPLGVQMVGRPHEDRELLAMARLGESLVTRP
ncbi:MAG: amidase [Acidimicrobiales bacterium]